MDTNIQKKIDEVFQEYDTTDTPGCALGIVQAGELIYSKGYGLADLETHTPITPDTVFHLASVSKQFTAACIALLEEEEKISLQDPVRKYLSFLPECGRELTLSHLVYMTNGLEDLYDVSSFIMGIPEGNYFSKEAAIRILRAATWLKFTPGEQWSYGNSGYFLLACIIEAVSGQPFDVFVNEHIFEPLGMSHSFVRTDRFMEIPLQAQGYTRIGRKTNSDVALPKITFQPENDLIEFGGAGNAWSSINDLVRWERNFFENHLGGKDSRLIEKMSRPGKLNDGTPTHYAYGQFLSQRDGLQIIYHEGGAAGVNTVLYRIPQKKLSIICLANTSDFLTAQLRKLGEECYERVAGIVSPWEKQEAKSSEVPEKAYHRKELKTAHPVSNETLNALAGNYEDPRSSHIWEVHVEDGRVQILENYTTRFCVEVREDARTQEIRFHSKEASLSGTFDQLTEGAFIMIQVKKGRDRRAFQRFLPLPLPPECLNEYEGLYTCAPLEAAYRVQALPEGIRLENQNPGNDLLNVVFTPTVKDMFLARHPPRIGWYVVHFRREVTGKIGGFSFRDEVPGRERWVFEKRG